MNRPSLTQFLDDAMRARRLDAVAIERETGVPASWTRQLKAGRMHGSANPERVAKIARALGIDEADLWQYLGRYDLVAAIRARPDAPAIEPASIDERVVSLIEHLAAAVDELARRADAAERRADALEALLNAGPQSPDPDAERLHSALDDELPSTPTPSQSPRRDRHGAQAG